MNDDKDDNYLTVTGRLFHARAPATEKARSPTFLFVRGTFNGPSDADRSTEWQVFVLTAYRALAGSPALRCGEICTPSHIVWKLFALGNEASEAHHGAKAWCHHIDMDDMQVWKQHWKQIAICQVDQLRRQQTDYYNRLTSWPQTHLLTFLLCRVTVRIALSWRNWKKHVLTTFSVCFKTFPHQYKLQVITWWKMAWY